MQNKRFVLRHELAKMTGTNPETINKYSDLGLLDFEQDGKNKPRYYETKSSVMRLGEITILKNDGYSLNMIKKELK